jgi:thiopeptide-type bacteriocin biosynthesis protein
LGEVMTQLTQELNRFRQSYLIDRIQLDTYQRELDRYGYNCMPLFEQLFYADSKMNIQLLNHCEEHGRLNDLWICGLYSMHTLCTIFELTIDEKERFLEWILTSFRAEFNAYSETTKEINQRYNEQKAVIQDLFLRGNTEGFNSFVTIVEERNADIKKLVDEIKVQYPVKSDQYRFLNSVIHMSINRLFRSHQRMYEYLITDFLKRISATMKYTKSASAKEQLVPLNVSVIE